MAENARIAANGRGKFCNMASWREATIEDLFHVPEEGKAEIGSGELQIMTPAGGLHGYAAVQAVSLTHFPSA